MTKSAPFGWNSDIFIIYHRAIDTIGNDKCIVTLKLYKLFINIEQQMKQSINEE